MADIDLIPADYAIIRQWRRRLLRVAIALALLALASAAARGWLSWRLAGERPTVEALKASEKLAQDRRTAITALLASQAEADAQSTALRGLRSGVAWEAVFRAIDGAYHPQLWFDAIDYQRELQTERSTAAPVTGGAASAPVATQTTARHRFEIQGHASTHASITEFLRGLEQQSAIAGARLSETGLRRFETVEVVDFKLSGMLEPAPGAAR